MTQPDLRVATLDDMPAIENLMKASMAGLGSGFYGPDENERAVRYLTHPDADLIGDGTYFVAHRDGALIGGGGWSRRKKLFTGSADQEGLSGHFLDPATDPAKLRAFFIHPDFARRGVGRALYHACAEAAFTAGFRQLELMATLPGVPFYRHFGFETIAPEDILLPDGFQLPCVRMRRSIS